MKIIFLALFVCSAAFAEGYESYEGLRIHSSCLETFGNDFPAKVWEGLRKGIACMKTLPLEKTPQNNLKTLEENYSSKIMIACHEPIVSFPSITLDAHASARVGQAVPAIGLVHPYMSFNSSRKDLILSQPGYIGQVAFHESFHHLGLSHGSSIEYPYACEECCFNDDPDTKKAACRICQSDYPDGVYSEKYGTELERLVNKSRFWRSFGAGHILREALILQPQSLIFRELILDYDVASNPLSIFSALNWKETFPSDIIIETSERTIPEEIKEFTAKAAEARDAVFSDKNYPKAALIYDELNLQSLSEFIIADRKKGANLAQAILDDMDAFWNSWGKEEQEKLEPRYQEIKNLLKPRPE